jgi:hypothetical protein
MACTGQCHRNRCSSPDPLLDLDRWLRPAEEKPLRTTPPREPVGGRIVIGDPGLPSPADLYRAQLVVGALIGDLLAVRRVVGIEVVRIVVGDVELASSTHADRADVGVDPGTALVSELLAAGRVGWSEVMLGVVADPGLAPRRPLSSYCGGERYVSKEAAARFRHRIR